MGLQWQKRRCTEPQPQPSTSRDTLGGHSSDDNDSDHNWSDAPSSDNNGSDDSNISKKGGRKSRKRIVDSSDASSDNGSDHSNISKK